MELEPVLLSKAAQLGLPAQWVARLARLDNQRRQVSTLFSGLYCTHMPTLYGFAEQNGQRWPPDCLYETQLERKEESQSLCARRLRCSTFDRSHTRATNHKART